MANIALHKKVIESDVKHPEVVTDGNISKYSNHSGFAYFNIPGTLTIDLEQLISVKCIRILLWDGPGAGKLLNSRRYQFLLAVSKDGNEWNEIFRTSDKGTIGWQIFKFSDSIKVKFIRIYGLKNTANKHFHVVELEAHDEIPDNPKGNVHIGNVVNVKFDSETDTNADTDIIEAKPTRKIDSKELARIIKTLEESPIDKQGVKEIKARFDDLIVLDQNLNAIRREIVNPVTTEIKKSNRLAISAMGLTIIGLIVTIAIQILQAVR